MHPDWQSGYRRCIPPYPRKCTYCINMHIHRGQPCPSMPPITFWNDACNGGVNYIDKSVNWPGKWSPQLQVIEYNRTPITPHTTTQGVLIPSSNRTTISGRYTGNWHQSKGSFNGWIHLLHHHHRHWWPKLGGARQKRSFIGYPHHIWATTVLRTTEMVWPPFNLQDIRRRLTLPNAWHVWYGTSKPALYGYSYPKKKRHPGFSISCHT